MVSYLFPPLYKFLLTKMWTKIFGDQKHALVTKTRFLVTKLVTKNHFWWPKMRFGDQIGDQIGDQKCDHGPDLVTKTEIVNKFGDQKCDQSMFLVTKSIWWPKPDFWWPKKIFGDQIGDQNQIWWPNWWPKIDLVTKLMTSPKRYVSYAILAVPQPLCWPKWWPNIFGDQIGDQIGDQNHFWWPKSLVTKIFGDQNGDQRYFWWPNWWPSRC